MPIEWAMSEEVLDDEEAITLALQNNWEPFAIDRGKVYFKQQVFNEDREPQSSTRHKLDKTW